MQTLLFFCIGICVSLWYMFENLYSYMLYKYFVKDNKIVYDVWLKHFIQVVSEHNYCMNYGLWDIQHSNLQTANENLLEYIFSKSKLQERECQSILDVGCGYGVQDHVWSKKLPKCSKITAIDISKIQIDHANTTYTDAQNVSYLLGDACTLTEQFKAGSFDAVLSVESAFHYAERDKFFSGVYSVLKEDGQFTICDIVLNPAYTPGFVSRTFLNIFSDFLHIPKDNLIPPDQWKSQLLQANFEIEECIDITDQTFLPYYKHFFATWMEKKGYPKLFANLLNGLFQTVQPFSYMVAVCRKPKNPWAKEESQPMTVK